MILNENKLCSSALYIDIINFLSKLNSMELYESEHTKFMRELFTKHPEWIEKQKAARALWWDKKVDQKAQQAFKEAKVAPKSYAYFDWFKKD